MKSFLRDPIKGALTIYEALIQIGEFIWRVSGHFRLEGFEKKNCDWVKEI